MDGLEGGASRGNFAIVVRDGANKLDKGIGIHSCEYWSSQLRRVFVLRYCSESRIWPTL